MTKIFISYRRNDSQDETNRIARALKRHFGDVNIVLDTDFPLGNDFRDEIFEHLVKSDIVLVVIGASWELSLHERQASKSSEIDWVLREIETALRENKIVIPVMLDNTSIPRSQRLPPSIQELPNRNGMTIRTSIYQFDVDVRRLIQKIERTTKTFVEPQRNTAEYLFYLLLNSDWSIQASQDANEVYLCKEDTAYRIVVDLLSDEREDDYTSEWADHFIGPHRTYPVHIKHHDQVIKKTYFASVWGAKYLVPLPCINGTRDKPIYYWDVHSIGLQLARHIARFHTLYKTLEDFAEHGEIELRSD
jgi:hypothetical protein